MYKRTVAGNNKEVKNDELLTLNTLYIYNILCMQMLNI